MPPLERCRCYSDAAVRAMPLLRAMPRGAMRSSDAAESDAAVGAMSLFDRCRCWSDAAVGAMPLLEGCRCWSDAAVGAMPLLERCRCWSDAALLSEWDARVAL